MKSKHNQNSPYVRKIVIIGLELGIDEKIVRENVAMSPYEPNPEITPINPLGKIPVLVDDFGFSLFDSTVICEYLSASVNDKKWFPQSEMARWNALRCNALANGMLEAAQLIRHESARPQAYRYPKWIEAQMGKVLRGFDFLEKNLPAQEDIGAIAVACTIGWIDYRFPDLAWRNKCPALSAWFEIFSKRPSFSSTLHPGQK